jgi:hypothetical protein
MDEMFIIIVPGVHLFICLSVASRAVLQMGNAREPVRTLGS